jgi:hypothetical protein
VTSLLAAAALLVLARPPRAASEARARPTAEPERAPRPAVRSATALILLFALASFLWFGCYDLFTLGMPARLERLLPGSGASLYFRLLLINTLISGALAVKAARLFHHPGPALVLGASLISLGAVIASASTELWMLSLGMLVWTVGELAFTSVSIFILGKLSQATARPGLWFATGTSLMSCGTAAAGALAFPLVINATAPAIAFLLLGGLTLVCLLMFLYFARRSPIWPELLL